LPHGFIIFSSISSATYYYWTGNAVYTGSVDPTPYGACKKAWDLIIAGGLGYSPNYSSVNAVRFDDADYGCYIYYTSAAGVLYGGGEVGAELEGTECPPNQSLDIEAGVCRYNYSPKQKGASHELACNIVKDPINFSNGNVFETEVDYQSNAADQILFSRYYNSSDGYWRHNFSAHLRFDTNQTTVVMSDGREANFNVQGQTIPASPDELGVLTTQNSNWLYVDTKNNQYAFNSSGQLIQLTNSSGKIYTLTYVNSPTISVTTNSGVTFTIQEDGFHQPHQFSIGGLSINYTYNDSLHLTQATQTNGNQTQTRSYQYTDPNNSSLLTGLTDERGIQISSWSYDSQGRAISNERPGAVGKVLIAYNTDGSTTVTNELGKQTTYQLTTLNDVKHITAIQGEPTPSCPASNSIYTYNTAGQVLTKTDAQGYVTAYSYNARGLEASRTEASGTPLARTTTTEWDPARFLKTQVVEPTRTTLYTYDAQGRPLSQQTTPN